MSEQLAYSQAQAAAMLGISTSHFYRHVRPQLPMPVYIGERKVWKHVDLKRWLEKQ